VSNSDKCKWCGAFLWDYGDVGPLHGKDGRSVNACELIQLRRLRDDLIARAQHSGPADVAVREEMAYFRSPNFDDIVERAKGLASREPSLSKE
jgi:hypothetical protein